MVWLAFTSNLSKNFLIFRTRDRRMYSSHSRCIVTMIGGGRFVALSADDWNVLIMFFPPLRNASLQTGWRLVMSSVAVARTSSYRATNEETCHSTHFRIATDGSSRGTIDARRVATSFGGNPTGAHRADNRCEGGTGCSYSAWTHA